MGDRANVLIQSGDNPGVYLYTHWGGYSLPKTVQDALKQKERWDDEQYLNRIIFCEMIKGQKRETTGYGITAFVCDGEDRIIHIDVDKQQITLKNHTYSFDEYIELDLTDIDF